MQVDNPRHGHRGWRRALVALAATASMIAAGMTATPAASALDNDLALTPPMGWNSWNQVRCWDLTEDVVKDAADQIVERGLQEVGYDYVVVDDCWQGGRGEDGVLFSHPERFPSGIPALADYVHALGLKFGIYGVPGSETCANHWDDYDIYSLGSHGHEETDARTFAAWGVDYLKYDWCRADVTDGLTHVEAFSTMRDILATEAPGVVYAISEYGDTEPWTWAADVANLWRTTHDIQPTWPSIASIIDSQAGLSPYSGPGAWNDPDMLQVGNGALTPAETRSHFGMWSMLAAPLFLGTDIGALTPEVVDIVTNPAVVEIDQDPLGRQAERVATSGGVQIWARPLAGGDIAVAFYNPTGATASATIDLAQVGATDETYIAHDAWQQRNVSNVVETLSATVPAHDTTILRLTPGLDPQLPTPIGVSGTGHVSPGAQGAATVTVTNPGEDALAVDLAIQAVDGLTVAPATTTVTVAAGGRASADLTLEAADDAAYGERVLTGRATVGERARDFTIDVAVVPAAPVADTRVSELPFYESSTGWGEIQRDLSVEGNPLTVDGEVWAHGVGTHAPSTISVWLGGRCTTLTGGLGVDDETGGGDPQWGAPSIDGWITGDGEELWRTAATIRHREHEAFSLDVSKVDLLTLNVGTGGDGDSYDHADWLGMALQCAAGSAPVFTTDLPATSAAAAGGPVDLRVQAEGTPRPTLTWERSDDDGATWTVIGPGEALAEASVVDGALELTMTEELDGSLIRVTAANSAGSAASTTRLELLPGPAESLEVTAQIRCLGPRAYLAVWTQNDLAEPIDVTVTTAYGGKTFTNVGTGGYAFHAFTTRQAEVEAGAVTVDVTLAADGAVVSTTGGQFTARDCG